jgi:hypothetical protein
MSTRTLTLAALLASALAAPALAGADCGPAHKGLTVADADQKPTQITEPAPRPEEPTGLQAKATVEAERPAPAAEPTQPKQVR